jgi:hypothetical protein
MGMADFLGMRFVLWDDSTSRKHVLAMANEIIKKGLAPEDSARVRRK